MFCARTEMMFCLWFCARTGKDVVLQGMCVPEWEVRTMLKWYSTQGCGTVRGLCSDLSHIVHKPSSPLALYYSLLLNTPH